MAKLGFIGLGIMGAPMAGHLLAGGHTLFLKTRRAVPAALLEKGGIACATPKEVGRNAEIVFLMLPDTPDVESVLFGKDGLAEGLNKNAVVVDMSTIATLATKDFAKRIEALGAFYIDAPVSGGDVGAKAAALTIMAGGRKEIFARVESYFALMGKTITHVGPNGDGQTAKAANQIIVALTIQAVAEALLFASKAGADPAKVRQALLGGFAASRILEVHGERMLKRSFQPGFRTQLHHKDLAIVLDGADSMNLPLPGTALCQQMFNAALGAGEGGLDDSAMALVLERMAHHAIASAAP
jgi:2-hydroxy-3-oxopropionate reductase